MEYGTLPQDQSRPLSFPLVGLFLGTYTYVNKNRDKNDIVHTSNDPYSIFFHNLSGSPAERLPCIANGWVFKSWSRQTQVILQRDRVIPQNTPISFVNIAALRRFPKTDVFNHSKCGTLENTNYNVDGN